MMKAIVAVDKNYGIGYNNDLLFHIPEDMKFFRKTTTNNVVVMGRKTFESMGSKPLKNRTNIVITSRLDLKNNLDIFSGSIEEMDRIIKEYSDHDIYIIGGSSIYKHYIDKCDELLITIYDREYENVDTYFQDPNKYNFYNDSTILEGEFEDHPYKITRWLKRG